MLIEAVPRQSRLACLREVSARLLDLIGHSCYHGEGYRNLQNALGKDLECQDVGSCKREEKKRMKWMLSKCVAI